MYTVQINCGCDVQSIYNVQSGARYSPVHRFTDRYVFFFMFRPNAGVFVVAFSRSIVLQAPANGLYISARITGDALAVLVCLNVSRSKAFVHLTLVRWVRLRNIPLQI